MISYRRADLIDKIKEPNVIELHGVACANSEGSWSVLFYKEIKDQNMFKKIEKVLLGYDDFKKTAVSADLTPLGVGYRSQTMDGGEAVILNLGEVISGIKSIPGVIGASMNRPTPEFVIRITYK